MIEITSGVPGNLVVAVAHGKVTGEDYEKVLVPAIEARLKLHNKIRVLYQIASDFDGYTAEAVWDDAKLGFGHWTAFEKFAVVADVQWITNSVKLFRFIMPCPVKVFSNSELAEARAWVAA